MKVELEGDPIVVIKMSYKQAKVVKDLAGLLNTFKIKEMREGGYRDNYSSVKDMDLAFMKLYSALEDKL